MKRLFFSGALLLLLAGCGMNEPINNANADPKSLDAAAMARLRLAGVPGGTGASVPPQANGGAHVGNGGTHRHFGQGSD
ncbi:MAG TPA: hypothetical protein VNH16_16840 [Burkholderiales bacterium]|jgi:hypothetical protein|nr:hypothetical protein [Burkholderiales bacterium]